MEIGARHLRRLVDDVDDQHREAMQTFDAENRELIFGETRHSRRGVLAKAGLAGAAITIGSATLPIRGLLSGAAAQELTDKDIARFAASIEFAAVQAYQAAVKTGKLSKPVIEAGTKFAGHHDEHGKAFAAYAGEEVAANGTVLKTFAPMIQNAADEKAIVQIAFDIENAAASTYLFGLGVLTDEKAYQAAASILPVEAQHAVVLGFVLGKGVDDQDLMPSFEPKDKALDPAKFPIDA